MAGDFAGAHWLATKEWIPRDEAPDLWDQRTGTDPWDQRFSATRKPVEIPLDDERTRVLDDA